MRLRKLNAGLSLLTSVLLLEHAMFLSVWMLSRCSIAKSDTILPRLLAATMVIHGILSIILAIRSHKGGEKKTYKAYPKMNIPTLVQRATGIALLLLLGLHIAGAGNHFQPKLLHAIVHPLFFAVALAHLAISVNRALITLGIGNAKTIRVTGIVMGILCGGTFVASVIGFYLCLFVGVAR